MAFPLTSLVILPENTRPAARRAILSLLRRFPAVDGRPIRITFRPELTVSRGKVLSRKTRGTAVHAASFMRRRRIVLDSALLDDAVELKRILVHELMHFAWVRAGNPLRHSYENLIACERCPGELGWSAEVRKSALGRADRRRRSRRWREYVCESFCDSGAWLLCQPARHREFTLPARFRRARAAWIRSFLSRPSVSI